MKIKELLNEESKWTKHATARNKDGIPISSSHPDAVRWCLKGAMRCCYKWDMFPLIEDKISKAINKLYPEYNNDSTTTHKNIIKLLNKADV